MYPKTPLGITFSTEGKKENKKQKPQKALAYI